MMPVCRTLLVACGIALILGVVAHAEPAAPVTIWVGPPTRDGFVAVDRGMLDSIADITAAFGRARQFRVVAVAADGTIRLDVLSRHTAGVASSVGIPVGGITLFLPFTRKAIDTVLRVGDYEQPFTSEDEENDHWRAAARRVVKDVAAWVDANRLVLSPTPAAPK